MAGSGGPDPAVVGGGRDRGEELRLFSRVEEISAAARRLLDSLVTSASPRDREAEAERARARAAERFGRP